MAFSNTTKDDDYELVLTKSKPQSYTLIIVCVRVIVANT